MSRGRPTKREGERRPRGIFLALAALLAGAAAAQQRADRPNVLWIDIDDQSPWYSSYGQDLVDTPNIDALAEQGVLFERAYAPTPVCSPTRSSLITGSYAIRIGAHDHRSGRVPGYRIHLPEGVATVPELFRAAGYETYNARERTVVVLFSDHGSDLPRSKEFSYDEGLRIPLIVVAPGLREIVKPGTRRTDLVNLMDVAATSLALAGLDVPGFMDAKDIFGPDYRRDHVFTSADRMSNVIDRVRSVVGPRFHYVRNFMLDRPLIDWGHREMADLPRDPDDSSFLTIRRLAEEGRLTPAQAAPYGQRVAEELYDLENDPDEVVNLAKDPAYAGVLNEMREALAGWIEDTGDKGQYARSQAAMDEIVERFPRDWLRSPEFRDQP